MLDYGLSLLFACTGFAVLIHAVGTLLRLARDRDERADDVRIAHRAMACRERECDLRDREIANDARDLELRERELVLEEREARGDDEERY
jgi:hypothetical protein